MASFSQWMVDDIDLDAWNDDGEAKYAIPCSDCTDVPTCSNGLTDLFAAFVRLGVTSRAIRIPQNILELCGTYRSLQEQGNPFCDPCISILQEMLETNRNAMWVDFPIYLSFPRDMKDFDA